MTINPRNYDTLIGIDEEVLVALTEQATPFIDDPNAVLRRVLGVEAGPAANRNGRAPLEASPAGATKQARPAGVSEKAKPAKPPRAPKGSLTPEESFERPILEVLNDAGGSMPVREVIPAVGTRMADVLNEHDQFRDEKGVSRWEKRVPFVRLSLVDRGLLDASAPRGVWQLTDAGRIALTKTPR